jgi:uncharacterized protein YgiM (DUF1202 family)
LGTVKHDFFSSSKAYLTLHKGDEVKIIKKYDDGWSEGAIGSQRGLFPSNFVGASKKISKTLDLSQFQEIKEDITESESVFEISTSKELPVITKTPSQNVESENESTDIDGDDDTFTTQAVYSPERNPYQNYVTVIFFIFFF